LVDGVRGLEKRNEGVVFEGEGGGFVARRHRGNIVVVTITVKRKISATIQGLRTGRSWISLKKLCGPCVAIMATA
jgi:hypothetical protein